jgi:hypothetical protein
MSTKLEYTDKELIDLKEWITEAISDYSVWDKHLGQQILYAFKVLEEYKFMYEGVSK